MRTKSSKEIMNKLGTYSEELVPKALVLPHSSSMSEHKCEGDCSKIGTERESKINEFMHVANE